MRSRRDDTMCDVCGRFVHVKEIGKVTVQLPARRQTALRDACPDCQEAAA